MSTKDNDDFISALEGEDISGLENNAESKIGQVARNIILQQENHYKTLTPSEERLRQLAMQVQELEANEHSSSSATGVMMGYVSQAFDRVYTILSGPVAVSGMAVSILGLCVVLNIQMSSQVDPVLLTDQAIVEPGTAPPVEMLLELEQDLMVYNDQMPSREVLSYDLDLSLYDKDRLIVMRGGARQSQSSGVAVESDDPSVVITWTVDVADVAAETAKWQHKLLRQKVPHAIKFSSDVTTIIRVPLDNDDAQKIFVGETENILPAEYADTFAHVVIRHEPVN